MNEYIDNQNITHILILSILFKRELYITFNEIKRYHNAQTTTLNLQYIQFLCYKLYNAGLFELYTLLPLFIEK